MISKLKTLWRVMRTVKNWVSVSMVWFIPNKEVVAVFKGGLQIKVSQKTWQDFMRYVFFFRAFPNGEINGTDAKISYHGTNLVFDFSKRGPSILGNVVEVFSQGIYEPFLKELNLKDRTVVDVGAALGDTAIYFALNGAKDVYAFEPTPNAYELAQKNIQRNGFEGRCHIFNAAVGKEKMDDNTEDQTFKEMFSEDPEASEYEVGKKKVPMTTLQAIVEEYKLSDSFLKMDCEGYEYDIILNASRETLRKFEYILMEYHYGFKSLQEKLESNGFKISRTGPFEAIIDLRASKYSKMVFGYLTARRID